MASGNVGLGRRWVVLLFVGHALAERPDRPEGAFRHPQASFTQRHHRRDHEVPQARAEAAKAKEAGISPEQLAKAKAELRKVEADVHEAKHENLTANQTSNHTVSTAAASGTGSPGDEGHNNSATSSGAGHHGSTQADPQTQVATEMLEAARKALQFAKEAHGLKAKEVAERTKLEDAVNASRDANATFDRVLAEYEAATNRSEELARQLVEAKQEMEEATTLAGSTQQELDSVLQEWAAANASAAETLGLLQGAQHTFAEANQSLVQAKAALAQAQQEEQEAKQETVAQAEKVLQAIQSAPAED